MVVVIPCTTTSRKSWWSSIRISRRPGIWPLALCRSRRRRKRKRRNPSTTKAGHIPCAAPPLRRRSAFSARQHVCATTTAIPERASCPAAWRTTCCSTSPRSWTSGRLPAGHVPVDWRMSSYRRMSSIARRRHRHRRDPTHVVQVATPLCSHASRNCHTSC